MLKLLPFVIALIHKKGRGRLLRNQPEPLPNKEESNVKLSIFGSGCFCITINRLRLYLEVLNA